MLQEEKVSKKIEHVVKNNIWGNIQEFLQLGFRFGEGDKQIHVTVGLLLLVILLLVRSGLVLQYPRAQ